MRERWAWFSIHLFPCQCDGKYLVTIKTKASRRWLREAKSIEVGLPDKVGAYPQVCQVASYAIARELYGTNVLLFDDQLQLDPEMVGEALWLLYKCTKSGMTLVIVTHEMICCRSCIFMADSVVIERWDT